MNNFKLDTCAIRASITHRLDGFFLVVVLPFVRQKGTHPTNVPLNFLHKRLKRGSQRFHKLLARLFTKYFIQLLIREGKVKYLLLRHYRPLVCASFTNQI